MNKDDGIIYSQVVVMDTKKCVMTKNEEFAGYFLTSINKDGEPDGLWTRWYEDGQKHVKGTFKDGKKVGEWIYYKEDGFIKKVENYD